MKLQKLVTELIEKTLNEGLRDAQDIKVALQAVNGLAQATSGLNHMTNDQELKRFAEQIRSIRIEIMEYVEQNSNYSFLGTGRGFKLIKKKG